MYVCECVNPRFVCPLSSTCTFGPSSRLLVSSQRACTLRTCSSCAIVQIYIYISTNVCLSDEFPDFLVSTGISGPSQEETDDLQLGPEIPVQKRKRSNT